MVVSTCNPSYLGGGDRRLDWKNGWGTTQVVESTCLANTGL
jgi:hypothetical protein